MVRALALVSGGLDSILAAKIVKEQGIDVIAVCFKSYFFGAENAERMTKELGIPLEIVDFSEEHLQMVKNPKHGHGKNMNPCIDCHAMMMRDCGKLLEKYNADFIITGEVLNQRPMSQNKASLNVVKKESGIGNKILRPLSAKVLPETEMELSGLVDREKLMGISGRGRKVQMELAQKFGINDYPSPAGGCKLTEPNYSIRLKELLNHIENPTERDLELLRFGRHFRVTEGCKIISSRTAVESDNIKKLLTQNDTGFLVKNFRGSMVVIIGTPEKEDIEFAAKVAGRYSKGKDEEKVTVIYGKYTKPYNELIEVAPAKDEDINKLII